jgi:hypothetical protein
MKFETKVTIVELVAIATGVFVTIENNSVFIASAHDQLIYLLVVFKHSFIIIV